MTNPKVIFAVFLSVLLLTAILIVNDKRREQPRQSPSVLRMMKLWRAQAQLAL